MLWLATSDPQRLVSRGYAAMPGVGLSVDLARSEKLNHSGRRLR
jgi:hypothetical protein